MTTEPTERQREIAAEILDRIGGWWDSRPADKAAMVERVAAILARHDRPATEMADYEGVARKVVESLLGKPLMDGAFDLDVLRIAGLLGQELAAAPPAEGREGELRRAIAVRTNLIQAGDRVYLSFATDADATACYEAITATPKGPTP